MAARPHVSVVLACYNEEQILAANFAEIRDTLEETGRPYEIIFVDDASRDRTRTIIQSIVEAHPELDLKVIVHDVNRGRGATVTDGFRAASGRIAGYLDVDLEVHSRYIPSLVRVLERGADVAIVRRIYAFQVGSLDRYLMSRGYSFLVRELLEVPFRDTETGYKFFRRDALMGVLDEIQDRGWFWDTEFMVRAFRRGLRIEEIPGAYIRRYDKTSTVSGLRDSLGYFRRLLAFRRSLRQVPQVAPAPPSNGRCALVCPACREVLASTGSGMRCSRCAVLYPEKDGILHIVSGRTGEPGYDAHHFGTLEDVEETHFWFVSRRELIVDALHRSVSDLPQRQLFDIGCGTGGLVSYLARSGIALAGASDVYLEGLQVARRRLNAPLVLVDEGRLPPLAPGQTLIGMFDVLEHIDDDQGTLRSLASVLSPGGVLVLTVPAHPFLFGPMDRLACHRRRYRRKELHAKLSAAGFEVRILTHFMTPLVPLLLAKRLAERWRRRPATAGCDELASDLRVIPVVNWMMSRLLRLERLWLRASPLPIGSSILAVATRAEKL